MSCKITVEQVPANGWCVCLLFIDGQPAGQGFGVHVTSGHKTRAAATQWWLANRTKVLALYEERVLRDARSKGAFAIVRRHS